MTDQTTPTISPNPDGDGVILHLPEITHVDTQVWSADVGLTTEGLAALRVLLGAPATVQQPPVDRAALRYRIAAAIWERQNPGRRYADCEYRWQADAEADADAVLAVLSEPAGRAATLREAADWFEGEYMVTRMWGHQVATLLRRLADEERDEREAQANLDMLAEAELRRRADEVEPATPHLDQAARARLDRLALTFEVAGNEFIADQIRTALNGPAGSRMADEAQQGEPAVHQPRRGDQFEAWLKAQRDACFGHASSWAAVDGLLDQYRLHADTGTPLGEHVCEARVAGDCECLERPATKARQDGAAP